MIHAQSAAERQTVVFDFDGTLVRGDSFIDFALGFCARRPHRLLAVLLLLPVSAIFSLRSTRMAGSVLLWAMTVGAPTRRFVRALHAYAQRVLPGRAKDAIFEELARQQQAGHQVVIATGTVPLLVRRLLRARGLEPLPIVGSRFRGSAGGLIVDTHCIGRAKLGELGRRLGLTRWDAVYTDSFADRSLMRAARQVTLVGPRRGTLLRTERLLAPSTELRVLPRG